MPYKRLDLPPIKCICCPRQFKPRRHNQRFCSEACGQAWYFRERQKILHSSGLVTPRPHRNEKPWGWKKWKGKDVYVSKGERSMNFKRAEDEL